MRTPRSTPPFARLHWLAVLPFMIGLAVPTAARSQNVNYSVLPTFEEIRWDDAFGLENARMPGIRLGIDFGPFFSLQPFYARQKNLEIRDGLVPTAGINVADRYDVETFGAEVQVNFGHLALAPFLKGGGGVLRTHDDIAGRRDRILLRGGGGISFALGSRARAEVFGERLTTRLPSPFIPGALGSETFAEDGLVNSLVLGAGVRLPFGGGYRATDGVWGILPGVYLEPYFSRIDFDAKMGLGQQHTAGARAGIDLNQNVGLRAFYWRGVDDEISNWDDLEGMGAELQFALNSGSGISPFLLIGGGRVKFHDAFRDLNALPRDREDHVTLGGGAAFGLGDRTRIELGVRNLLMTAGEELQDVTTPSELVSNWQYSAGFSFALGARPRTASSTAAGSSSSRDAEFAALRAENERLRRGEAPARVPVATQDTGTPPRMITVPVPEVGEIILRYGAEYARGTDETQVMANVGLTTEQIEALVRETVRRELERTGTWPGAAFPVQPGAAQMHHPSEGMAGANRTIQALMPYIGAQFSPGEFLLGLRANLGPISSTLPIDLIPDVTFGLSGGSPTMMVGLNSRFGWNFGEGRYIFPYVEAGVALSSRNFMMVNLGYGAEFDATIGSTTRTFFVQHRGLNAFREHQFLLGVRLPR